jgi:CheY-like chemotaxis protein
LSTVKLTTESGNFVSPFGGIALMETTRTVLVLAGDERARDLVVFLLERDGYHVFAASTPSAALRILEEHSEVDLLFGDLQEPDAQAFAGMAEQARQLRPNLKLLYTAGLAGAVRTMRRAELAPEAPGPAAWMLAVIKASLE